MGLNSCFFLSLKNHNVIKLFYAFLFLAFLTKRQNKKFSSSGKKFCFYSFYFFVDCSHFPPRSTVDFKPNFFFQLLQQVYLSTCVSRETKLFIYFYYQSFSSFFLLSFFLWILFSYLHFHSNEFNFSQ